MTYDFVGNKFEIELNENRKMILDAMKELKRSGKIEVRPIDIIKHLGATSNSKEGKRISRTIQRMASNYEITSVVGKYVLYKLNSEEDINHNHY